MAASTTLHSCSKCDKHFVTYRHLTFHKWASPRHPFYCRRCDKEFASYSEQSAHLEGPINILGSGESDNIMCTPCSRTFDSFDALEQHLSTDSKHLSTCCISCMVDFHGPRGLQKHNDKVHKSPSTSAETSAGETEASALEQSTENSQGEQSDTNQQNEDIQNSIDTSYMCRRCQVAFVSAEELRRHLNGPITIMEELSDRTTVKCRLCDWTYPNVQELTKHIRGNAFHDGRHRFACFICLIDFHSVWAFNTHRFAVHPPSTTVQLPSLALDIVPTVQPVSRPPPTVNVIPTPSVVRPYCQRCRLRFTSPQELAEHLRRPIHLLQNHPDGRKVSCRKCRKCFNNVHALRLHLNAGLREHENTCAECMWDYHDGQGLDEHKLAAHGINVDAGPDPLIVRPPSPSPPPMAPAVPTPPSSRPTPTPPARIAENTRPDSPPVQLITESDLFEPPDPWGVRNNSSTITRRVVPPTPQTLAPAVVVPRAGPRGGRPTVTAVAASISSMSIQSAPAAPSGEGSTASSSQKGKRGGRKSALAIPCPLCLETATDLTSTECGHVGCKKCLTTSIKIKPECPMCRTPMTLLQIHPLFI